MGFHNIIFVKSTTKRHESLRGSKEVYSLKVEEKPRNTHAHCDSANGKMKQKRKRPNEGPSEHPAHILGHVLSAARFVCLSADK
jgi:hypothetical protein